MKGRNQIKFLRWGIGILVAAGLIGLLGATLRAQTKAGPFKGESYPQSSTTELAGWVTNGAIIFQEMRTSRTNSSRTNSALFRFSNPNRVLTNLNFFAFQPQSLGHAVWTNYLTLTNGRNLNIWTERVFPARGNAFRARWNPTGVMWGLKGLTALAPHWEADLGSGQSPITALTRRHGYTRGHGMGYDGFTTNRNGLKVWFLTPDNRTVEVKIKQSVVRTLQRSTNSDYCIVLFDRDLPEAIEPLRVTTLAELRAHHAYLRRDLPGGPHPIFLPEQRGQVSTSVMPLVLDVGKGGDSGCPNLLPLPGELVFFGGRSTTGPAPEMQADMDALCRMEKLDPRKYQLQQVDLAKYPTY